MGTILILIIGIILEVDWIGEGGEETGEVNGYEHLT